MATSVVVNGVTYPDVPRVRLPLTNGNYRNFWDCSNANAEPSDVANGKVFYNAYGQQTGTNEGGQDSLQRLFNGYQITDYEMQDMQDVGESHCFYGIQFLTDVTIPSTITSIYQNAFANWNISSITADGVTTAGMMAFYNCRNLRSLSLDALESAGGWSFQNLARIRTLRFPSLTVIPDGGFQGCYELANLWLGNSSLVTFYNVQDVPLSTGGNTLTVHVPANLLSAYQADADWQQVIEDCEYEGLTVTLVGDYA